MAFWRDKAAGVAVAGGLWAGGLLRRPPRPTALADRLAMLPTAGLPLRAPVSIRWNDHAVPFITAAADADLPVALGAVQAHLRLAQLEIMRRLAQGRVAEMAGPLGLEYDRALLLFDFAGPVPAIIAALAPATRQWAEGFLAGINHHLSHAARLPHDCALLGIGREPWTLEDLFTVARLASADVSWIVFARLLRARRRLGPRWGAVWRALLGGDVAAPGGIDFDQAGPADELARFGRMGSNCAVVAGWRSASGGALIASDPHLGLGLPNLWLLAGLRGPGIEAVGLMLAGFPFIALGRSRFGAWGGTSLHAASSELIDVSGETLATRRVVRRVRGGRPRAVALRGSVHGPVVSDGVFLRDRRPLALRWVGQAPSDEFGAMLALLRAENFDQFRAAFRGFAVPAQTMLHAGADGRIGRLLAGHLPRRPALPPADLTLPPSRAWTLDGLAVLSEEAWQADAPEGFFASANDEPPAGDFPVGFFFSPDDRVRRLRGLLGGTGRLDPAAMMRVQADVVHPGALPWRDWLLAVAPGGDAAARAALAAWDGSYAIVSAGALVFEVTMGELLRAVPAARRLAPVASMWTGRRMLAEAMRASRPETLARLLPGALDQAGRQLRRYGSWGGMHRAALRHPLARLPLVGRRFRWGELAAPGGNETLNKTGHGYARRHHVTSFGSSARHVSDMADPDANFFVLFGGQDGWIGSANALDQMALWQGGGYVRIPLRPESVIAGFRHETVLRPC